MQKITIIQATIEDIKTLQYIATGTFFETFAQSNTDSDMKKYLEESFSKEKLSTELNNPDSLFFLAFENDHAVGYLKLNSGKAQTELHDEDSMEIERIYVLSSHHGQKVGQLLYEKALEIAESLDKSSIWLGVWVENPRAIRFYSKNGFVAFDQHIFKMGEDEQLDIMMRKIIR